MMNGYISYALSKKTKGDERRDVMIQIRPVATRGDWAVVPAFREIDSETPGFVPYSFTVIHIATSQASAAWIPLAKAYEFMTFLADNEDAAARGVETGTWDKFIMNKATLLIPYCMPSRNRLSTSAVTAEEWNNCWADGMWQILDRILNSGR